MSKHLTHVVLMVVAALGVTVPLSGQSRSTVSRAELDAAVAARASRDAKALRGLLTGEEARRIAGRMGVSPAELSARVAALDPASLNRIAQQAGVGDRTLAGGSEKVVISTTVIIIALLILILLVK